MSVVEVKSTVREKDGGDVYEGLVCNFDNVKGMFEKCMLVEVEPAESSPKHKMGAYSITKNKYAKSP